MRLSATPISSKKRRLCAPYGQRRAGDVFEDYKSELEKPTKTLYFLSTLKETVPLEYLF